VFCIESLSNITTDVFRQALAELAAVVGVAHVQADDATRALWSRSTLPRGTVPAAVVRPACTEEVQQIVCIAARRHLPIHPLSCGKNWGYSDACAPRDGQIILDLRRMNRIVEVNEELAYATIEPGVTQGQLAAYLEERGLPLWVDATGAGPDASIVGNTLERGFGHTIHGDRFLHACGMEIVLADGRLLKTGFGHYEQAQAAAVYKWGVGPYLDGLFTQSNLGIVTRLTFWLIPKPAGFRAFLFSVRDPADVGGLVEALRRLRLAGTLRSPVHLFNDQRLLTGLERYPWAELNGRQAVSAAYMARMRKKYGMDAWHGSGALYGSKEEVAAAATVIRRALRRVPGAGPVHFLDDRRMRLAEGLGRCLARFGWPRFGQRVAKLRILYDLLQGKPSAQCLQGARWRVQPAGPAPQSADPLDHQAGLLWLSPVLPMTRAHLERVTALAEPLFVRFGFEYQVTLSSVTARALCAVMTIAYNKADAGETERAQTCYNELLGALMTAGYVPYRLGNLGMDRLAEGSEVFWDVTADIKAALDPQGILSPGHYEPFGREP
jgi:4-cresol dehydrogenase (hydroxylating) flavoprotein subunit